MILPADSDLSNISQEQIQKRDIKMSAKAHASRAFKTRRKILIDNPEDFPAEVMSNLPEGILYVGE